MYITRRRVFVGLTLVSLWLLLFWYLSRTNSRFEAEVEDLHQTHKGHCFSGSSSSLLLHQERFTSAWSNVFLVRPFVTHYLRVKQIQHLKQTCGYLHTSWLSLLLGLECGYFLGVVVLTVVCLVDFCRKNVATRINVFASTFSSVALEKVR